MISQNGEIKLLTSNTKIIALDSLEAWQSEYLTSLKEKEKLENHGRALYEIEDIYKDWLDNLTAEQWKKISRQKSIFGIEIPKRWVQVWRIILKEPKLRDSESAARGGRAIGSYFHLWNVWAEDCIDRFLDPIEKELLRMVDAGYPYQEIGIILRATYEDKFWKIRKENTKTTPSQVVNNYLYHKMPNSIARQELTEICLNQLK